MKTIITAIIAILFGKANADTTAEDEANENARQLETAWAWRQHELNHRHEVLQKAIDVIDAVK